MVHSKGIKDEFDYAANNPDHFKDLDESRIRWNHKPVPACLDFPLFHQEKALFVVDESLLICCIDDIIVARIIDINRALRWRKDISDHFLILLQDSSPFTFILFSDSDFYLFFNILLHYLLVITHILLCLLLWRQAHNFRLLGIILVEFMLGLADQLFRSPDLFLFLLLGYKVFENDLLLQVVYQSAGPLFWLLSYYWFHILLWFRLHQK